MSEKMTPAEFASKFEKAFLNNINSIYDAIAECLGYDGNETSGSEDLKRFFDTIRNLDVPEGIPYPLDKDGVPIKIGDTVYHNGAECKVNGLNFIVCGDTLILVQEVSDGEIYQIVGTWLTHKKPRTLEDIKDEATSLVISFDEADGLNRTEKLERLIEEAHEIGRKEAQNGQ